MKILNEYCWQRSQPSRTGRDWQLTAATTNPDKQRLHEQFGYAYDASGNLAWRTNRNLKVRFQSNGLNQLTNVSRTGTLTVAGISADGV